MNKKVNIDIETIKYLYSRYKNYLIPITAILCCVILFFYVIIPQIKNIQNLQEQKKQEVQKLEVLRNNLILLSSLDSKQLDEQLKITSKALPTGKDFIGILSGISIASEKSSVELDDYSFRVGVITDFPTNIAGIPNIELELSVKGNFDSVIDFVKELKNTLPLLDIKSIDLSNRGATINTMFYYKALPPVKINDEFPLSPISASMLELINNLSNMNNSQKEYIEQEISTENSSPSGSLLEN